MGRPTTLDEWRGYVEGLQGPALFSQTVAVNNHRFARVLMDEGYSLADVEEVVRLFARQCRATTVALPEGGAFNLKAMAADEMVAVKSEEELTTLRAWPGGTDDVEQFLLDAEVLD